MLNVRGGLKGEKVELPNYGVFEVIEGATIRNAWKKGSIEIERFKLRLCSYNALEAKSNSIDEVGDWKHSIYALRHRSASVLYFTP